MYRASGREATPNTVPPVARVRAQRVTSRDIAREAGVSQPTVSRALRGDPRVAPATAALI
jgi:transcriptional regulator with XRE-family HTH domain